jgi:hypothetical protein
MSSARFAVAEELIAELKATDERGPLAYGVLFQAGLQMTKGEVEDAQLVRSQVEQAARTLAELGDERGIAIAEWALGNTFWMQCRAEAASAAYARGREHAERAGDEGIANAISTQLAVAAILGPTPMSEALPNAEKRLAGAAGKPLVEAQAKRGLGRLLAQVGEFERARALLAEGTNTMREAGLPPMMAGIQAHGFVERLAGDNEAAAEYLRQGAEAVQTAGRPALFLDRGVEPRTRPARPRPDRRGRNMAGGGDCGNERRQTSWTWQGATSCGAISRPSAATTSKASRLAQRAVEIAEQTDFFEVHANTYIELGHVLALAAGGRMQPRPTERAARGRPRQGREPPGRTRSRRPC